MSETTLQMAERHVREGRVRVAEQRQRVADLASEGRDTTEATRLLETMFQVLRFSEDHWERLLAEQDSN